METATEPITEKMIQKRGRNQKGVAKIVSEEKTQNRPLAGPKTTTVAWESDEFGSLQEFQGRLDYEAKALELLREAVKRQLKKDMDYGVIPGTPKPSLWKPGAEKIANLLGLIPDYLPTGEGKIEGNFLLREYKCVLRSRKTGKEMGSCIGSCNSYETKHRYRYLELKDLPIEIKWKIKTEKAISKAGNEYDKILSSPIPYSWRSGKVMFRIENENPYDLLNVIDKMAQKRAFVGAVINASRLSIDFTHDIDSVEDAKILGIPTEEKEDV